MSVMVHIIQDLNILSTIAGPMCTLGSPLLLFTSSTHTKL